MSKRRPINNGWWIGLGLIAIGVVVAATELRPTPSVQAAAPDTVVVFKSPTCNCCSKWIEHLRQAGMQVEVHNESEMSLVKTRLGVPEALASCHTATVNGYVIEGHVPVEDIKQLLATRPKAKGIAVPGMPVGSPGMEMGNSIEPYDVLLIPADQQAPTVFAHHGPSPSP